MQMYPCRSLQFAGAAASLAIIVLLSQASRALPPQLAADRRRSKSHMDVIRSKPHRCPSRRRYAIPRGPRYPACDTRDGTSHIQNKCEDRCSLEITLPSEQGWLEEASPVWVRSEPGSVSIAPEGEEASGRGFPPECEWRRVRKTSFPRLLRRVALRSFPEL